MGADDRLDPRWCELFYAALPSEPRALNASGMFDAPIAVDEHTDVQSKLLARLGRNPSWQPHVPRFPCLAVPQTGPVAE